MSLCHQCKVLLQILIPRCSIPAFSLTLWLGVVLEICAIDLKYHSWHFSAWSGWNGPHVSALYSIVCSIINLKSLIFSTHVSDSALQRIWVTFWFTISTFFCIFLYIHVEFFWLWTGDSMKIKVFYQIDHLSVVLKFIFIWWLIDFMTSENFSFLGIDFSYMFFAVLAQNLKLSVGVYRGFTKDSQTICVCEYKQVTNTVNILTFCSLI